MPELIAAVPSIRNDAVARFRAGEVANAAADTAMVPGGVPNAVDINVEPLRDDLLDVGDLVRMFEESESASYTARQDSQRDRDYVDNKQHTAEEIATLNKRGQPVQMDNRIKTKIDYLVGLEKQQRINPKALPRTPAHEQDADGATEGLRYVADEQDHDFKRSAVWRNLLVEGAGGMSVAIETGYGGEPQIVIRQFDWDRMFWDPHSAKSDFSDAGYLGAVVWMDYDDALIQYPEGQEALDTTLATAPSDTYDDKPKWSSWADKKRKRVRIVQMWLKRDEEWHFAEFTKGGILKAGPSPYVTDKGESDCELIFQSAYVDRDNNRYGLVREMISLQDGINKRNSKSLHLLNTAQIVMIDGAVNDVEKARKEAARPDGVIIVNPLGGTLDKTFKFETRVDLAQAQFLLLQEAKQSIDLKGPNATQMGDKAQGSAAASGRAIIASQQGGMVALGDLLDNLRHLDKRVFRAIFYRMRQAWTAEKWIRVTDDERNVKWVGMNVDPAQFQNAPPEVQEKIAGLVSNVAELDCDIIIDEVPDSVTPALEQWQGLVELAKSGVAIPPKTLIMAAPNLKNKDQLIEEMEKAAAAQQQQPSPEMAKAQMELQLDEQKAQAQLQLQEQKIQADIQAEAMKAEAQARLAAEKLNADIELAQRKAEAEINLAREKAHVDLNLRAEGQRADMQLRQEDQASQKENSDKERESTNKQTALTSDVQTLAKAVAELAKDVSADVEIVRGKDGKPSGVRRVRREYAASEMTPKDVLELVKDVGADIEIVRAQDGKPSAARRVRRKA